MNFWISIGWLFDLHFLDLNSKHKKHNTHDLEFTCMSRIPYQTLLACQKKISPQEKKEFVTRVSEGQKDPWNLQLQARIQDFEMGGEFL